MSSVELDQRKLTTFVRNVETLNRLPMVTERMGFNLNLNYHVNSGMDITLDGPNEDALRSLLVTFRKFISPNEKVFLIHVFKLCFKYLRPNNKLRDYLSEAQVHWHSLLKNDVVKIKFNDRSLSPDRVRKLWINGYYFHDDFDKYDELARLLSTPASDFIRANFLDFIINGTRAISYVGKVVRTAFQEDLFDFDR